MDAVSDAIREFLVWVAFRPRTHADAMEAWGSHCPRFTLWEDALEHDLAELESGSATSSVRLTARGQSPPLSVTRHQIGAWAADRGLVR